MYSITTDKAHFQLEDIFSERKSLSFNIFYLLEICTVEGNFSLLCLLFGAFFNRVPNFVQTFR